MGHTVNFGRPWLCGSRCEHGLISHPYLDDIHFEQLDDSDGSSVHCHWLLPICKSEVDFMKRYGLDAIESKFEDAKIRFLDPCRDAVA
ncbi:MAG: suppressor of fused domain protein [Planctomycetales bacterium]|nr:suppressor of fused domain protein [Planctomycetales bacterium]